MAKVLMLNAEDGEHVGIIEVHPPPGARRTTVGDMWKLIEKAVARLGHELNSLDLAEWVRDQGREVPEDVSFVVWVDVDYRKPWVQPGKKEWRPED
jgi:hypothetical protein